MNYNTLQDVVYYVRHETIEACKYVEHINNSKPIRNQALLDFLLAYGTDQSLSTFLLPSKLSEIADKLNTDKEALTSLMNLTINIKTKLLTICSLTELIDTAVNGISDIFTPKQIPSDEGLMLLRYETREMHNVSRETARGLFAANHWLLILFYIAISGFYHGIE